VRVAVVGAGPTGLVLGTALARRSHTVTLVDRDPGPPDEHTWPRKGVMQFHHAHLFRSTAVAVVRAEMPDAYDAWLALGAEPAYVDDALLGVRSTRETFERAVRSTAEAQAGLTIRRGHADEVLVVGGRAAGLHVDGDELPADVVVDASGRSGRATADLGERAGLGGACGIAYVDRVYRLRPDAEPGPMSTPMAYFSDHLGYLVLIFPHEHGLFSVILIRGSKDKQLTQLRQTHVFDAACRAVPGLADWTDPERAVPVTSALTGGNLLNVYRSHRRPDGALLLPGLLFAGDSVCTPTPIFGRGVATSLLQVAELLRLLDDEPDVDAVAERYADWCDTTMQPWVVDHIEIDEGLARRWSGQDIDLEGRIPSDLVLEAAGQDPEIAAAVGPWASMTGLPASLDPVRDRARAVYAGGWRPPYAPGPSRDELVALLGL
jgi:2-polyprenyl-6-methoxyphenol hydroxylase-like FAD-dependent oxidoreductase